MLWLAEHATFTDEDFSEKVNPLIDQVVYQVVYQVVRRDITTRYPWISEYLTQSDQWRQKARRVYNKLQKPADTGWLVIYPPTEIDGNDGNWISRIDRPESWNPGCLAIPVGDDDDWYYTHGGNCIIGATAWRCISRDLIRVK